MLGSKIRTGTRLRLGAADLGSQQGRHHVVFDRFPTETILIDAWLSASRQLVTFLTISDYRE